MKTVILITLVFIVATSAFSAQPEKCSFFEEEYLFEVMRHLYRWYLDETDVEKIVGKTEIKFLVRELDPELDPGDKSRFGEIVIPALDVRVAVKKADYTIEKLGLLVKNDDFKIISVAKGGLSSATDGYKTVITSYQKMRDYAHRTRAQARFPEDELLLRMRSSARRSIFEYMEEREKDEMEKLERVIHIAPLSEIANETWVFWEAGRMLIHFSSDIDLENPAIWDHDEMTVKLFNIDEQTVVSLDEVAGSNAYMTRDQVGRILFNCIVLGQRIVLESEELKMNGHKKIERGR